MQKAYKIYILTFVTLFTRTSSKGLYFLAVCAISKLRRSGL